MKRIFYIIIGITAILCFAGNSTYAEIPDTTRKGQPTSPVGILYSDLGNDTISVNGKIYELKQIPQQASKWYDDSLIMYILIGLLIILALAVAYLIIVIDNLPDKRYVKRYVNDNMPPYTPQPSFDKKRTDYNAGSYSKQQIDRIIERTKNDIMEWVRNNFATKDNRTTSSKHVGNRNDMASSAVPLVTEKNAVEHKVLKPIVKYAVQDASDKMKLMSVSDKFDEYDHTFVITMNPGSESDGTFEIIHDETIIQKCLKNTDSIQCCQKVVTGNTLDRQVPGTVTVNGNYAIVKTPLQLYLK